MAIESSKPKKQRKYLYSKPLHKRQKDLSGHLSKKLRQALGKRSLQLRKGDTVRVMKGAKRNSEGKIMSVDYKKSTVCIEKLTRKKTDGTEIPLPVKACNLLVTDVDRSDSRRFKKQPKGEKAAEKHEAKTETGKEPIEKEKALKSVKELKAAKDAALKK
ncbi:MAG: 50S ribosomal protein L24 [Candidatus Diapherotrites archaeon]|nr:50S ribosomal protein L24 [Candidatus Diapherotrites archaeon]